MKKDIPECSLEQTLKVLGAFNPATLLIKLGLESTVPVDTTAPLDFLKFADCAVLAHELAHFFQTTTTPCGIRCFAMWIDYLVTKLDLINDICEANNGSLVVPLFPNTILKYVNNEKTSESWVALSRIVAKRLQHYGGYRFDKNDLKDAEVIFPGLVYKINSFKVMGIEHSLPVILISEEINDKEGYFILGAKHLREGGAKIIDLIQARFVTDPKSDPVQFITNRVRNEIRQLWNPYYVTNTLFSFFSKAATEFSPSSFERKAPIGDKDSIEYLYLISDLCMLFDNYIANWSEIKSLQLNKDLDFKNPRAIELNKMDISPGEFFIRLLSHYFLDQNYDSIKELIPSWGQVEVNTFQQGLADTLEFDIIQALEQSIYYVDDILGSLNRYTIFSNEICDFYCQLFKSRLQWRIDLGGGAIFCDLLTDKEKLYKFFSGNVPAFEMGKTIISNVSFPEGTGIGVHFHTLAQLHELTDSLIFGTSSCEFHKQNPRNCFFQPKPFCDSFLNINLKEDPSDKDICIREQTLRGLLKMVNCKELLLN